MTLFYNPKLWQILLIKKQHTLKNILEFITIKKSQNSLLLSLKII